MMSTTTSRSSFFSLRDAIERESAKSILSFGKKNRLRDACEYALLSGGKRLRPIIVMMVADALGNHLNVIPSALAVEFMHTASLIADDLPCMDNKDERRNTPTVHKAYGEPVAILASYSLIFAAYEKVHENGEEMRSSGLSFSSFADTATCIALKHSSRAAGILGATSGQFLDLYPPNQSLDTLKEILYKKTVTLFEIAFVFGWLFGGGVESQLDKVKECAYHFGMAFQVADDLGDIAEDREINAAKILGKDRAKAFFQKEMEHFKKLLKELSIDTPSFHKLCDLLSRGF